MEIEKERQKMIKEFKEMQDNLYCKRSFFNVFFYSYE